MVGRYLDGGAQPSRPVGGLRALVAPHAGYVYSGPVAGSAFHGLGQGDAAFERVVLLGPSHFYPFAGLALPDADAYETPLGKVPLDRDLVDKVRDLPRVLVSEAAHAREHSLEVELPFLQEALGGFSVLPLVVGDATPESVAELLERVWSPDVLVVISTDLSHYLSYEQAVLVDGETARRVVELDSTLPHDRACGATPLNGLLLVARRRGLAARLVDLCNSGDTAGDRSRVVGYGAFGLGAAA
jgi:AmmeMemoRadiSam system protein B